MKKIITLIAAVHILSVAHNTAAAQSWNLTGNAGTSGSANFIGTTDNINFKIRTKNIVRMTVTTAGNVGIGITTSNSRLYVNGGTSTGDPVIYSKNNWVGNFNVRAIEGYSIPNPGWGYGVVGTGGFTGVYGSALGTSNTGTSYGVYGIATGTAGTRTGVYGTASGGTTNWAGYFDGNGYFQGNVGIGTTAPASRLHVNGNASSSSTLITAQNNYVGNISVKAIEAYSVSNPGYGFGVYATGGQMGVYALSDGASSTGTSYGIFGVSIGTAGKRVGVYGSASGGTSNWGGYFDGNSYFQGNVGIGTETPASCLHVNGNAASTLPVIYSKNNYAGNADVKAIEGYSVANPGYGTGVYGTGGFIGVRGLANATTYAADAYGVYGEATGTTAGRRYGVFGTASGGTTNWAGYFLGNGYFSNNVGIGTTTPQYKLDVCGVIRSKEVRVETGWCDYVFANDYKLPALTDVETYIKANKHLPGVTAGSVIENEGLEVGKTSAEMIKKIEELTLYVIDLQKQVDELKKNNK
jgi:hypothetical protein